MSSRNLFVAVAVLGLPGTLVAIHNRLIKSTPAADQSLAGSPKEIRLWFAEQVEPKFSSISLLTADSAKIDLGKARGTDDPKSIAVDVAAPLAAGSYTVIWRTAGDDGHAVRGRFAFSVAR